uniref:Ubiquitin specific peptidase 25 n=1 Tax=Kryptolebias marmoratus TaxID=37003 RepID=A0A3Q3AL17_KRYMA
MFGQYPLQVNGFKDLHECLEAAMIEGEIESLHSAENSARSGQEHWFTELPPVLTFELSRFEFNQALALVVNKNLLGCVQTNISFLFPSRYLSYGSGPKRFPLVDVLQYAMEFASSKPVCTSPYIQSRQHVLSLLSHFIDITVFSPCSTAEQDSLPSAESPGPASTPTAAPTSAQQQRVPVHKPFTQSRLPPDLPMHPAPRHITEEELKVLEGCLHRWRSEVENDTRGKFLDGLSCSVTRIHRTIDLMYSDKSMMQVPYRLHAVLVHEGQANAGHYWAYIYDPHQCCWMKYNDISVTKSSWEELVRDSFGGYRNASAYCLMYINDKKPFLIEETGQVLSGMDKLPPDLKQYVMEDNELFDKEIEEWDAMQARKAQQEKLSLATAAVASTAASSTSTTSSSPQPMSIESSTPDNAGTGHSEQQTIKRRMFLKYLSVFVFGQAIKLEYARLLRFAQEDTPPENDYRLQHIIVYFIQNEAPKKILERTLLTQFADRNLAFDERCKSIMNVARAKLALIKPEEINMDEYEMWHQDYRNFRETTIFMVTGLELFQKSNYVEALMYLIYSYQYNKELLLKGLYRGHNEKLLGYYRRESLLKLNEQAAAMFELGEEPEVTSGLSIMNELVVPCIPLLLANDIKKDLLAVEDMRNRWCSYLGQEMESNLQEKLTDFLPKLLDCSTEIKSFHDPPKLPSYSTLELCERFGRIMAAISRAPTEER